MAVMLTTRWPELTAEGYERLHREITAEGTFPSGLLAQVAAREDGGVVLIEVWDAAAAADEFRVGTLSRAAARVGHGPVPSATVLEVHRIIGPGGRPFARTSRRVLVVANQTLGSTALEAEIHRRAAQSPHLFHLLVPARPARDLTLNINAAEETGDLFLQDQLLQKEWEQARHILDEHVEALRREGLDVSGEVGLADPAPAVRSVLDRRRFDEVILSTLPSGISRWLKMDLPTRLGRSLDIPLTVITAEGPGD